MCQVAGTEPDKTNRQLSVGYPDPPRSRFTTVRSPTTWCWRAEAIKRSQHLPPAQEGSENASVVPIITCTSHSPLLLPEKLTGQVRQTNTCMWPMPECRSGVRRMIPAGTNLAQRDSPMRKSNMFQPKAAQFSRTQPSSCTLLLRGLRGRLSILDSIALRTCQRVAQLKVKRLPTYADSKIREMGVALRDPKRAGSDGMLAAVKLATFYELRLWCSSCRFFS